MLKKIDHIGIAVGDLEIAIQKYSEITGKSAAHKELVAEHKVATAFFPVGEIRLELLKGTDADSPISKFIEKRGEGIHHICFEVDDLAGAKATLTAQGLHFIEQASEQGAGGSKVAFIHPKSTGGILMELVEYPKKQ
jgi:methylmalonyl-CoA/ethylmalonyl-CoA epimerase